MSVKGWRRRLLAVCCSTAFLVGLVGVESAGATDGLTAKAHHHVAASVVQLRVTTLSPRAGNRVTFSLAGTRLRRGAHVRSLRIAFGDGESLKLRSTHARPAHTFRRPGVYRTRLVLVDSSRHRSTATRTVIVARRKNRVVLRKTTSRLRGRALVGLTPLSPTRDRLVLGASTRVPSPGHTLLIGRSSLVPNGLIARVESSSRGAHGDVHVTVRDVGLTAAFAKLSVAYTHHVGKSLILTRNHARGVAPTLTEVPASDVPFVCSNDSGVKVDATADFSKTEISAILEPAERVFSFSVIAEPTFTLDTSFEGSVKCELGDGFTLNIPVPSVPGLEFGIGPYFDLTASGAVSVNATWNPSIFLDISRAPGPGGDSNFFQVHNKANATGSGSASVTLDGGIQATISAGNVAGLRVSLGPQITASVNTTSSSVCLVVTSDIELEVQLFANVFFVSGTLTLYDGKYFDSTLVNQCTSGSGGVSGSGSSSPPQNGGGGGGGGTGSSPPYVGPVVDETTGSAAQTWTNYADAGGEQGQDIGSNQTIGIVCRVIGLTVPDGNNWWYLVGSAPWNATFYTSADAFYNGPTSVPLRDTPFVDSNVPLCSSSAGPSPSPTTPPSTPSQPTAANTYPETTGSVVRTWTDYADGGGTEGPEIGSNVTVQITCRVQGLEVPDTDTWWYQIASSPWDNTYYSSADPYYNDGQTSGGLHGTPLVDTNVPVCGSSTPPPTTYSEATGHGPVNTWSNPNGPSGTEGPTLSANTVYQVDCVTTGTAEGHAKDAYWYRISGTGDYGSADAFCDEGATTCPSGFAGTPDVDPNVPSC
jgi:hypothetical protein